MKKVLAALMVATLVLAGCGSKEGGDSKSLIIYSPNSEGLIASTIPAFEAKYDIKVDLIQAGTGELFTKMNSESNNPVADVMFGGAYSTFTQNENLFEPYTSPNNDNVLDDYKNKTGYITPYVLDGSVLIVNNNLLGSMTINGYKDLLNPDLKGKIATADPASSSSAFAQLTNMLIAMGGYEDEGAWDYVKELFMNIDGKLASGSSNVYKSVADGELVVGLTYEDPSVALLNSGADVTIIYPEEGTVFLPAGSAIIKGAKNMDNAKLFIDFIISQEIQDVYGTETTNRPVLKEVMTSETMTPMAEINTIAEDIDYVRDHKDEMVEKYKTIFAEIESNK